MPQIFNTHDIVTFNDEDYVVINDYDNLLYCHNFLNSSNIRCFDTEEIKMSNNQFIKPKDFGYPIHLAESKEHDLFRICCNDLSFDYTKWGSTVNNLLIPADVYSVYNNYYSFRTNKVTCEDCLNYVKLRDL